jgi:epoxyqueuosine reductase
LSYEEIEHYLTSKFFYIKKESLWRWKLNARNVMVNEYNEEYQKEYMIHIQHALEDKYEIVRKKARWALEKLELL